MAHGILCDWDVNAGDRRSQLALALFRAVRATKSGTWVGARAAGRAVSFLYTVTVRWTWGIDLPWMTEVGPRLRLYHGTGLVVNSATRIGADVALRQGVTLGARHPGGPSPHIGDRVDVGSGSQVLGDVHVGPNAVIGAGAIVIRDVPEGATAVGNPARVLPGRDADSPAP